ncbi:enoyl-ACP reductase FabI [Nocardia sp. NPDC056100]|uniref:enoyl-ACP reductase FabI n=1 Tax=Nocardia sp. NPDC056100 TaxID=3345712 RepID=UPI0035DF28EA
MGLLDKKTLLVTGVLTPSSIAYGVAELAQREGARVIVTGYGRLSLVRKVVERLPETAPVIELDVSDEEHLSTLSARVGEHADRIDGVLHAIAFAPQSALGGNFLNTEWADVATALRVSTYSLVSLATALRPLLTENASIVGLDFDASTAYPGYDWMGVAKAGLESAARYLATYLGPQGTRVNLVAAGPIRTVAASNVPSFDDRRQDWSLRAPLGWDISDSTPVARACVALLSEWFPATTGEIVHVDGGAHAVGN